MTTPSYIKALLKPNGKKPTSRKVWGIDLEVVWLPFFTATNTQGDTAIPHDALGYPIRLAYASDGSVKFNPKSGKPVTKVAKELAEAVRLIRENLTANLMSYTNGVITDNADGYKAQIALARQAGEPMRLHDQNELDKAIAQSVAEAVAEAVAEVIPQAETEPIPEPQGELVTA